MTTSQGTPRLPEAGRGRTDPPLEASKEQGPADTLIEASDFHSLSEFQVLQGSRACGAPSQQPLEMNTASRVPEVPSQGRGIMHEGGQTAVPRPVAVCHRNPSSISLQEGQLRRRTGGAPWNTGKAELCSARKVHTDIEGRCLGPPARVPVAGSTGDMSPPAVAHSDLHGDCAKVTVHSRALPDSEGAWPGTG